MELLLSSSKIDKDREQADKTEQRAQNEAINIQPEGSPDKTGHGSQPYLIPLYSNTDLILPWMPSGNSAQAASFGPITSQWEIHLLM